MTLHSIPRLTPTPIRTIAFLAFLALLAALWLYAPSTDPAGHLHFVNGSDLPGVPNSANVLSNLPFLGVGLWGIRICLARKRGLADESGATASAFVLSAGLVLTAFGSTLFHLAPSDETLFWDRLPMAVTFMSLLSLIIIDRIGPNFGPRILAGLIFAGLGSLVEWRYGGGDLRPYIVIQYGGIAALLFVAMLFPRGRIVNRSIYGALGFYVLAKVLELNDAAFFDLTGGTLSGHAAKHLAAAAGAAVLVRGLKQLFNDSVFRKGA